MTPIACTVGITAYNEAENIGRLLQRVCEQQLSGVAITEIIVVASGCTDGTVAIVAQHAAQDGRIRLVEQAQREGKASALNLIIKQAQEQVIVLCSGDLLPEVDAVSLLVAPFVDDEMGLTACRPQPINNPDTFMGFAAHLLWGLHHHISSESVKAGEMIAFRRVFERIPNKTAVDEASVEPLIRGQGYGLLYVPNALVYNKGPDTISDFLRQRRRIAAGHLELQAETGYAVSTMGGGKILRVLLKQLDKRPKQFVWTWCVVGLEVIGRFLGGRDYKNKRSHTVWEIATTTKQLGDKR